MAIPTIRQQFTFWPQLVIGCLSVSLLTCRPTDAVRPGDESAYFPLTEGHYVVYDVSEQQFSLTSAPVQRTYQVKERIEQRYTDATGQPAFRLLRFRRSATQEPWQPDSVWSARLVNNEAIRTENGLDFVKLVFPLSDRLRWDGNRHNAAGSDEYELRNSRQPYRVHPMTFGETVTVVAQNDSTLVSQDKRVEVYARQVGLIYRERIQLHYCSSSPGCIGRNQIDYGIRQFYRIRTYGTE